MDKFPAFRYKLKRTFKDCLSRQVHEAVAIFLADEPLLNGKNEYMSNCISRVTVNEDNFEKKKREFREEMEEKERLIKLEAFKNEKCVLMNGLKRKRGVESKDYDENKSVKMLNPKYEYSYVQKFYPLPPPTDDTQIALCDTQHTPTHPGTVTGSTQGVASTGIRNELHISYDAWSEQSTTTNRLLAIEYLPDVNNVQEVSTGMSDAAGPPQ